jgi:hypothetical protein
MDVPTVGTSCVDGAGVTGQHQVGPEPREGAPAPRRANETDGPISWQVQERHCDRSPMGTFRASGGLCCVSLREARLARPVR